MPCSMPPLASDMTGRQAKEQTDGVELCPGLCLASMFPKKHMPEHIIQRGMPKVQRGEEDGGSCTPAFQTPGCRFLYLTPLVHVQRAKEGVHDQSDQPARPAREAVPKIVDQCPSASTPGWIVSELGLDLTMGSVLHCSSKHNTSQPLCDSLSGCQSGCLRVMSSCACTDARPFTVWCMPWPQVLHDSVDVVSCASFPSHPYPWTLPRMVLCCCIALGADPFDHYTAYVPCCSTTASTAV